MRKNYNKGITLIALVVTIVVLLILAGVSISMLTGESGIISQAQKSKNETEQARLEELVILAVNSLIGKNLGETSGITPDMVATEVNEMENRTDVTAEGSTFPTNILFAEENRKVGIDIDLSITEIKEKEVYSIAGLEEEAEKNIDLFDYEILSEAEVSATSLDSLPTKEARIIRIKPEYCNGGGYDPDAEAVDFTDTNYEIVYNGVKISDKLVIPYQVEIEGELYKITEVNLYAYGRDSHSEGEYRFPNVKTVIYPNTVKKILGKVPNRYNGELEKVVVSENLLQIGDYAFGCCMNLTSITIPASVTKIGDGAFFVCSSLTSITIPDGVQDIGREAFYGCSGLTSITIPDGVADIGNKAFYGCSSLTSITIPDSVKSIGAGAFDGCSSLTSITIPDSVKSIGAAAFYGCYSLTNGITIPEGTTNIDYRTFCNCSNLTSITIPSSITSVGYEAFYECGIRSVNYAGTEEQWNAISIEGGNTALTNATINYNYTGE